MGKKKAIDCPEVLGGCGTICQEVGRALGYPKQTLETRPIAVGKSTQREIHGHEYRYTCPNCGKEWVHDTLHNEVWEIKEADVSIKLVDGKEFFHISYTTGRW